MVLKQFLVTLTKIKDFEITCYEIKSFFADLDPICQITAAKEFHEDGTIHCHAIVLIITYSFSKNTYKKVIREGFPQCEGRGIDIQGIRNLTSAFKYIIKGVAHKDAVYMYNITWEDVLKKSNLSDLLVVEDIAKYATVRDWVAICVTNAKLLIDNKSKVITIWSLSRSRRTLTLIQAGSKFLNSKYVGIPYILHLDIILFLFKFALSLYSRHSWKQTNILIRGVPNCGKSRFFKKVEVCLGIKFYWCSRRPGDFRNWNSNSPIILIDDVISSQRHWPISFLLKCLGREGFTGDAKINFIVDIPVGIPVSICTNCPAIFTRSDPLQARLINCPILNKYDWNELSCDAFLSLIGVFKDIVSCEQNLITLNVKNYKYISTVVTNPLFKGVLYNLLKDGDYQISKIQSLIEKDIDFLFFFHLFYNLNREHFLHLSEKEIILLFIKELADFCSGYQAIDWGTPFLS
jgi:hypothetical protein